MPSAPDFKKTDIKEILIPHQVAVDPQSGSVTISVDVPLTGGRNGFGPELSLSYGSGGGNSTFGTGWALAGLASVSLFLKDGYPEYGKEMKYSFGGQELIPLLEQQQGTWVHKTAENGTHFIYYYRPQIDTTFIRLEKWVQKTNAQIHWRLRNKGGQLMIFGMDPSGSTRISDPMHPDNVFQWMIEAQYDNLGNAMVFEYVRENHDLIDLSTSYERHRANGSGLAQQYIKRIKYGNTVPAFADIPAASQQWLFEVVMDYGEHGNTPATAYNMVNAWPARFDPFSTYGPGFEVRTYRLCRRILMFHHITELGNGPTLIGNLQLTYLEQPTSETVLQQLYYTGYKRNAATNVYEQKSLPPLAFQYSQPDIEQSFTPASISSVENVPAGIGGGNYKWIDLYGEGLPGILFEMNESWYYKPNLGNGILGPQELVAQKPSALTGVFSLSDFDGDGNINLVVLQGRDAGYYEYDRDSGSWGGFTAFAAAPQISGLGSHTQLVDITGNGLSDLVTVEQDRIIWFAAKGKDGFEAPVQISKPSSNGVSRTPTVGVNAMLDYFLADMTGDGLPDQVRVQNGRVEYWPNLGYGRFGEGIVMENAPVLDHGFEFDAAKVRLIDLIGTGTSDLLYIGKGEITYWINLGGNKFLPGKTITGLPYVDQYSNLQVMDFLGDGLPCLVWSAPLDRSGHPLQYLKLNQGMKPHLLLQVQNNMGQEVNIHYGHSAKHYLRDKNAGSPWLTRLPSHSVVVDEIVTIDHIGNTRFKQRYEYHDGYFDGEDRAFRGFGLVDHYDSDAYQGSGGIPETEFTDPVCTRTWYHSGNAGMERKRAAQYYSGLAAVYDDYVIEDEGSLNTKEFSKALKGMSGQVIRTEIYGLDKQGRRNDHPFQVDYSKYLVRRLQPSTVKHDAVFGVFSIEQFGYTYENIPTHPRIQHTLNLVIDQHGSAIQVAKAAYPSTDPAAQPEQQQMHLQLVVSTHTFFDDADNYILSIPLDEKSFELNGIAPAAGNLLSYDDVRSQVSSLITSSIPFNAPFTTGAQARLMQWVRTYYWNDALTAVLPFGTATTKPLMHHMETACFNDSFLADALDTRFQPSMPSELGYVLRDNLWWHTGEIMNYRPATEFNVFDFEMQPDGSIKSYTFDAYFLNIINVTDPAGNTIAAQLDYHFLAPDRITDINMNVSEVLYDPLGIIACSTIHGTIAAANGAIVPYGNDALADYTPQTAFSFEDIVSDPQRFVQGMSIFTYYELDTWQNQMQPLRSITISREEWVHPGTGLRQDLSRSQVDIDYLDAFGRSLQVKKLVDPGLAIARDTAGNIVTLDGDPVLAVAARRWLVSGHAIYNNKQNIIRQFEEYYSPAFEFESDELLEHFGHSTLSFYDAVGRNMRTEFPDGTLTKTEITPWLTRKYDQVDAIEGSVYELEKEALLDAGDPEKLALHKAQVHKNTPVITYLDSAGRAFLVEESNSDGLIKRTRSTLDFSGSPVVITDPRTLVAFTYKRDMLGRAFHEHSLDAGDKWQFPNASNKAVHLWDARGVHQHFSYDALGRVTSIHVDGAMGMDHTTERLVYGESLPAADAINHNQRGQLAEHYSAAGVLRVRRYNLMGTVLDHERQLVAEYKNIPDWTDPSIMQWLPEVYSTSVEYDAIGRLKESRLPDNTTRRYTYLQSGEVSEALLTTGDGAISNMPILHSPVYNARGQQTQVTLGNGVVRNFHYHPHSYRLARMTAHLPATGRQYQDIRYTYDAAGNLVFVMDEAQSATSSLISGLAVSPQKEFTYDSFYQLVEARGRTHQSLDHRDYAHAPDAPGFIKGTRHLALNNGAAIRRYRHTYQYDLSGNMLQMTHRTDPLGAESPFIWQRNYWVSNNSNRSLPALDFSNNPVSNAESRFDAAGNCVYLPHLHSFEWNYVSQLKAAVIIERTGQPNDAEYYVYGPESQRMRKVTERLVAGQLEITEKIYLDGCEIKRIRLNNTVTLNRITSQLTNGQQLVALLHQWTVDTGNRETDNISQKKIHYQLGENQSASHLELNEAGDIISYEEYFPFGCTSFIAGNNQRDIRLKDYRYSGKERDDATGLYYYGYRYYATWMCRWLSPDPIGHEDALNLYQFTHNNPVNEEDEEGLQSGGGGGGGGNTGTQSTTNAPMPWPRVYGWKYKGESGEIVVNNMGELHAWIKEWKKTHPDVPVNIRKEKGDEKAITLTPVVQPDGTMVFPTIMVGSKDDMISEVDPAGTGDGAAGEGAFGTDTSSGVSGSNEGSESNGGSAGNGNDSSGNVGNATGITGTIGNGTGGTGAGVNNGTGTTGTGNGKSGGNKGNGTNGAGAGIPGFGSGINGGNGSGRNGNSTRSRTGPKLTGGREGGTGTESVDPDAPWSLNGVQGSNGTGDVQIGPPGATPQPGDPSGDPDGSPNGRPGGKEKPRELEWWETALIVAAVIVVVVVLTIATAGVATAVLGTAAATSLGGLLAIGTASGFVAGFAGDLTSQSLTLAFQDRNVIHNLDVGQAFESGAIGGVVGFATAGTGAAFTSSLRGSLTAANSARAAGTATLTQRAMLSTEAAFNNSATVRTTLRATSGAATGGFGGSTSEATRQLIKDGRISNGDRVMDAGLQGMAFGAVLNAGIGHVGDRARAAASNTSNETVALPPASAPPASSSSSFRSGPRPLPRQPVDKSRIESAPVRLAQGGRDTRSDRMTVRVAPDGTRMVDSRTGVLDPSHGRGTGTTGAAQREAQAQHTELLKARQGNVMQAGHTRPKRAGGGGGAGETFPQWGSMNGGQWRLFEDRVMQLVMSSGPNDRIIFSMQPRYPSATATMPTQVVYFLRINGRTVVRAIFSNMPGRKYARFF
ncbi:MAG TPA: SpvB/TcaC N-terminal domain-containing protein [Chitinophagaceae bacterium]|nr:SpvB/TcaC N-terminal domain-containing protein [Chitinophagaceae bacterium]